MSIDAILPKTQTVRTGFAAKGTFASEFSVGVPRGEAPGTADVILESVGALAA